MVRIMTNIEDSTLEFMRAQKGDVSHIDPLKLILAYERLQEEGDINNESMKEWLARITSTEF